MHFILWFLPKRLPIISARLEPPDEQEMETCYTIIELLLLICVASSSARIFQLTQSGNLFDPQEINEKKNDFYIDRQESISCFLLMKKRKSLTRKSSCNVFARKSNMILSLLRQIHKKRKQLCIMFNRLWSGRPGNYRRKDNHHQINILRQIKKTCAAFNITKTIKGRAEEGAGTR